MIAFNRTRGGQVAAQVVRADNAWTRAKGLLGRASMAPEEGMWIEPCAMIHMFFMAFAIDVVFLDSSLKVVRVVESIQPWRVSPWVPQARSVLELAAGAAAGKVAVGDQLEIK